jgi:hypothetical protein
MPDYARLLIIEHLVGAPNERPAGKVGDILMMVRTGGRNRTGQEFCELLSASGFSLSRMISTPSGPDFLEASPTTNLSSNILRNSRSHGEGCPQS